MAKWSDIWSAKLSPGKFGRAQRRIAIDAARNTLPSPRKKPTGKQFAPSYGGSRTLSRDE